MNHKNMFTSAPFKMMLVTMLLLGVFPGKTIGQGLEIRNDVPVVYNGDTLEFAWAGGMNCPQFSTVDLDLDGNEDLVVFDRYMNNPIPFLRKGSGASTHYEYAPEFETIIPDSLYGWVLFRDFNGDGQKDIFAGTQTSYLQIYKNNSQQAGTLSFQPFIHEVYTHYPSYNALYTAQGDVPGIADLDGDGDLDIITLDLLGINIEWHKNVSVDSGWGLDSFAIHIQSYCYGHFSEDPSNCSALINQTPCQNGMRLELDYDKDNFLPPVHAGSTLLPIQLNNDSLVDLIVGDATCNTFYALNNNGTTSVANFGTVESNYPSAGTPVNVYTFPAGFYEDVDFDGVKDLIAAVNQQGGGEDRYSVWMYKNTGQNTQPNFQFQKTNFMQGDMVDAGSGAYPAFFDYDGDGLLDMIMGNRSHRPAAGFHLPSLRLFHNVGSSVKPVFELVDTNYLGLLTHPNFDLVKDVTPAPGDLDGDNDIDLLLGSTAGRLFYFRNDGTVNTPNYVLVDTFYQSIRPDAMSSPVLNDLDGDTDLDLLVGTSKGYIAYYKNNGTNLVANFDSVTNRFGKVKINNFTNQPSSFGNSRPFVVDIDSNGMKDLLVGGIEGYVEIFYDITLGPADSFPNGGRLLNRDFGVLSAPTAAVLDTTGRLTYVIGEYNGGLRLAGYDAPVIAGIKEEMPDYSVAVFPNPAHDFVQISLDGIPNGALVNYRVVNALGMEQASGSGKTHVFALKTASWASGIYFVSVDWNGKQVVRKLIIN